MKDYETILLEVKDGLAIVTVNRPDALNAINTEVLDDLLDVFCYIQDEVKIKAVILTGAGRSFVAGADIAQMSKQTLTEGRDMSMKGQKVMETIENLDKPVIAAVNGFALGGGCELAMACDIRLASEKAKFGQPEVNLGIIPGFGGTQRLSRLVGKGMAKYLIFTAEIIGAEEACRIGLVEKVFAPKVLLEEAERVARQIMSKAPIAVKMAKTAINNGGNMDLKSAVSFETEAYAVSFASGDRVEGMEAFLEKRQANFKNE